MPNASSAALLFCLLTLPLPLGACAWGQSCPSLVPLAIQPPIGQAFQVGCAHVYEIKEGSSNGITGGYGGIDFSQTSPPCPGDQCAGMGPGAIRFICEVTNSRPCCLDLLQCALPVPGDLSGPTKRAVEVRFAADTDQREDICYREDIGNGSRVVTSPLTGPKQGPGNCYIVYGFGSFFIRKIPGGGTQNFLTLEVIDGQVTPARHAAWGEVKLLYR